MKANKLSFPYPVLGIGDDIAGSYRLKFKDESVELNRDSIKINVTHLLSNGTLERLVREKQASYCVEIQCPQTIFREIYPWSKSDQTIEIPTKHLRNATYVTSYIVAMVRIEKYKPSGLNADYGDNSFIVEKGDVLAYYDAGSFLAGKTWEVMRAVSSIISVKEDKTEKNKISFVLTEEKIVVKMPTESFRRYGGMYKIAGLRDIFLASVALPAVMYALANMMQGGEQNENIGSTWYEILETRRRKDPDFKNIRWETSNIPLIAQAILGSPIAGALKNVENILNAEFSSTDV